jgi:hypothetical protein
MGGWEMKEIILEYSAKSLGGLCILFSSVALPVGLMAVFSISADTSAQHATNATITLAVGCVSLVASTALISLKPQ